MPPKRDTPVKHFILAFLIAVGIYAVSYSYIEHRRLRQGPWTLVFSLRRDGTPEVVISEPALHLERVTLLFPGRWPDVNSNNLPATMFFREPRKTPYGVPFGKVVFMDPTFLPGTLTIQMFGHEIELLPRVLILDHTEHQWKSREEVVLTPLPFEATNSPASLP